MKKPQPKMKIAKTMARDRMGAGKDRYPKTRPEATVGKKKR